MLSARSGTSSAAVAQVESFRSNREEFWGRHRWARVYFVATTGNVTDEVIAKYVELPGPVPQDDDLSKTSES